MTAEIFDEPDYMRPFGVSDFRGYFTWRPEFSEALRGEFYHACHEKELRAILSTHELGLRSKWKIVLPSGGEWQAPGVWVGLNYYHTGNHHGPFLFEFPADMLDGRSFMVFRRTTGRRRYFFVQYEAQIPIFEYEDEKWRKVDPTSYFDKDLSGQIGLKPGAIYDIVLTSPVSIARATLDAVDHPACISRTCSGNSKHRNTKALIEIEREIFLKELRENDWYQKKVRLFRTLVGEDIELPSAPGRRSTR